MGIPHLLSICRLHESGVTHMVLMRLKPSYRQLPWFSYPDAPTEEVWDTIAFLVYPIYELGLVSMQFTRIGEQRRLSWC